MTIAERILEETKDMPVSVQQQVLDFTLFLKEKQQKEFAERVNRLIDDNLKAFQELAK
ncbi:MAG: hypothetical protein IKH57_02835 [Clostridia bacterium]|nr:hypothetical protein [Clostridia bacterium]